jgi:type I restriction enzyme S subunit
VNLLAALDDKIELNRRTNETLEAMIRTLFRAIVTEYPAVGSVYALAEVSYGAPYSSLLFNEAKQGFPLIRIRDLTTHDPSVWTTEAHPREVRIEPGNIVVGMDGEFRAHVWKGPPSVLNQRLCAFRPKPGIPRSFVWQAIQEPLAFYESAKTGTTVIHLSKADIDRFEVPVPHRGALGRFGAATELLVDRMINNAAESRTLAELRDTLLPKLISGEIRVRNIESAVEEAL